MKYLLILFFMLMALTPAVAQNNYTKHKVEKNETVADIAKKYKITPYDIYRLNPDSKNGIRENTILLIPKLSKPQAVTPAPEKTTTVANTIHQVQPKETLYSLSKKYNVTVDELKAANSDLVTDGLQIGQKIIIPAKGNVVAKQVKQAEKLEERKDAASYFYHTVAPGDTKYSIAKQYGMTLQLLEALNPEVKDTMPVGIKLKLDRNALIKKEIPAANPLQPGPEYVIYTVQPKETLYSLLKRSGITEEQLLTLNPEVKEGLKDGMELRLPKGTVIAALPVKTKADLLSSLKKTTPKQVALLLPFNLTGAESDTIRMQRLRGDRFLNMTLDFYAGALMAIDSAKTLGLPLKVTILDSKETRNTSDIDAYKSRLAGTNAIIGPFFQSNVETTAEVFPNIAVISPLSKESSKAYSNLFQSVPPPEKTRAAMLEYLKAKTGNIVAIVDSKKASSRQLIKDMLPDTRFLDGGVTATALSGLLVKDRLNYVILETESTNMIVNATRVMADLQAQFPIQMVVLEKTDALDHDEVPVSRLTALKMLYPSVTNDFETPSGAIFNKVFRQKNGITPSQFATRGFDVTFDVILRLFQQETFAETAATKMTEQVENRFDYTAENGGNYNTAHYILQYNEDLSVKEAE